MGWRDTIQKESQVGKPSWRDTIQEDPTVDPSRSPITAATTGLIQGAVPFAGAIAGVGKTAMDAITGTRGPLAGNDLGDLVDDYRQARDSFSKDARTSQEANPGIGIASNIAGGFANPLFKGADTLPKVIGASALQSLGQGEADLTKGELGQAALDTAIGAGGGALGYGIGKGITSAIPAAVRGTKYLGKKLGEGTDYLLKKGGKIGTAVPEPYISEYLSRKGNISARETPEIIDDITSTYADRYKKVAQAERDLIRNKDNVSRVENNLKDKMMDLKFKNRFDLEDSRNALNEVFSRKQEGLKQKNVIGLKDDISEAISNLKNKVSAGSQEGYRVLDEANGSIDVSPILNSIENVLESFKTRGKFATDADEAAHTAISKLRDRIQQYGENLSYPEVKQILQSLDRETQYNPNASAYDDIINSAKKSIRSEIDHTLKWEVPEYNQVMKGVSSDAQLLNELTQKFGTDDKVLGRLSQMGSVKGRNIDGDLLKELGQRTGKDFNTPIQDYLKTQDVLKSPNAQKALKEGLPEYSKLQKAVSNRNRLFDPATKRTLESKLALGPEYADLKKAEEALIAANREFEPISPFETGIQNKVNALTGKNNLDTKAKFAAFDQATGKNLSNEIKDRAILDSFNKSDMQGSRKTLLGKATGAAIGAGLGYNEGGEKGAGVGALVGFSMDKYSGQVLKAALDGRIGAAQATEALSQTMGKYAPAFGKAAAKGPEALATLGAILSNNPEFRKLIGLDEEQVPSHQRILSGK